MNNQEVLIIVESPTKAKTIKKFLPSNYKVIACNGHIRVLSENNAIDIKNDFKAKYEIDPSKKDIIKKIKDSLKKAQYLLLATDEDREGESISWHLKEVLKPKVEYKRMVFHQITKSAITKALANKRDIDLQLVESQEARRLLDRLFGFSVSKMLWSKLSKNTLSAGRVQSPGLRLIVEREKERLNYTNTKYKALKVELSKNNQNFFAMLNSYDGKTIATSKNFDKEGLFVEKDNILLINNEKKMKEIIDSLDEDKYEVLSVEKKKFSTQAFAPFTTSTLQMEANRKLKLSAKNTMRIAQNLYEEGYITYMRTDSPFLSEEGTKAAISEIKELYGDEFLLDKPRVFKAVSASAQEAHEAIRPSGEVFTKPANVKLGAKEKALYELIYKRTIASQMKDAIKESTSAMIKNNKSIFNARGISILFLGFLKAYTEDLDEDAAADQISTDLLPILMEKDKLKFISLENLDKVSNEPYRYTEATLVKELEKLGIGRPSTYATIISTLKDRSYVVDAERSALIPTLTGFIVSDYLTGNLKNLVDYKFTKKMEEDLDKIANGEMDKVVFLKDFYLGEKGLEEQLLELKGKPKSQSDKQIHLPKIDSKKYNILFGPNGAYLKRNETSVSLPVSLLPYQINEEVLDKLSKSLSEGPKSIGKIDNQDIFIKAGSFGPYWQIGEDDDIKRASIPKNVDVEDLEQAKFYLSLPKLIATKDKKPIELKYGRYGFYLTFDNTNIRIPYNLEAKNLSEKQALEIVNKQGEKAQKVEITLFDYNDMPFILKSGRYGLYISYGKENIALPKEYKDNVDNAKKIDKDLVIELYNNKRNK